MSIFDYDKTILGYIENVKMQILSRPLNLGGVTSLSGGVGGPPGGFVGQLPQTKVTYDLSELASSGLPVSGWSLLDNLNHIRYRLNTLENTVPSGITGTITVKEGGVEVSSDITVLDFVGATVDLIDTDEVRITFVGGTASGVSTEHIYNEVLSGTQSFSTTREFIPGTVQLYYNGIRQAPSYFTEGVDNQTITVSFSGLPGDEFTVDYDYVGSGTSGSTTTSGISSISVQNNGTTLSNDITVLNATGSLEFSVLGNIATLTNTAPTLQAIFTVGSGLAVGSNPYRIYNATGQTKTISKVFLSVSDCPTGAAIIVDVNKNGTTIFTTQSNRPTIVESGYTGYTTSIDVTSWAADEYLTVDIDQVGAIIAGNYLTVHVVYN